MTRAFLFPSIPSALNMFLSIALHPITLLSLGPSVMIHVRFLINASNSSCIACFHRSVSLPLRAYLIHISSVMVACSRCCSAVVSE